MENLTKKIATIASLVAMAVILEIICDAIPFLNVSWLEGGGISLACLPLVLLAYRYGVRYGILGGLIYGVFNLLTGGKIYHWLSPILDYILAFGVVGIAGLFKNALKGNYLSFILGFVVFFTIRAILHVISGMVCFEVPLWGSITYNSPYVLVSMIVCIIVGLAIYKQIVALMPYEKYEQDEFDEEPLKEN